MIEHVRSDLVVRMHRIDCTVIKVREDNEAEIETERARREATATIY